VLDVPPNAGRIRLSIYGVHGRLVRTLVDGDIEPGRRSFTWRGVDGSNRDVASGVYFAVCSFGGRSVSQKLVLVR
jgi:hypothetical protein